MSIFQRVIRDALAFLKPGRVLLIEIGMEKIDGVTRLFDRRIA